MDEKWFITYLRDQIVWFVSFCGICLPSWFGMFT